MLTKEYFIDKISKHININNIDIKYKKNPYAVPEQMEVWLYKRDSQGEPKKVIVGYKMNDKTYRTKKQMQKDFTDKANYYQAVYGVKFIQTGLVVTEDTLEDEEYLKEYIRSF